VGSAGAEHALTLRNWNAVGSRQVRALAGLHLPFVAWLVAACWWLLL
jgi:hypothetical protein